MKTIRSNYKFSCIAIGIISALIINYKLLEIFLIPDVCYYHFQKPSFIFELFYSLPTWNGGHPFPTLFNLFITIGLGTIMGYKLLLCARPKFQEYILII